MSHYYARFDKVGSALYRFETRVYLTNPIGNSPSVKDKCIAAVIAKNPGSAKHTILGRFAPISIAHDSMLPNIRSVFLKAFKRKGRLISDGDYIQILNLSYFCSPDINDLKKHLRSSASSGTSLPSCPTVSNQYPIVWYAWGGSDRDLDPLKGSILKALSNTTVQFFYDHTKGKVTANAPSVSDFAKHPQGMPHDPVVRHLSGIV